MTVFKLSSNRGRLAVAAVVALTCASGLGFYSAQSLTQSPQATEVKIEIPPRIPVEQSHPFKIAPSSTLYSSLREHEISSQTIHQIVTSTKPVFDLARLRAGTRYQITKSATGDIASVEFYFSPIERLMIKNANGSWTAEKIVEQVETRVVTFRSDVQSTLWESAERAQMDPTLITALSEIFAWQVDFNREMRVNSRWRLSVEQKLVKGEPVGWGSILAAELENDGRTFNAVLHRHEGEDRGYFAADGSSLKRMFLKSPIPFGRISSRFAKKRFHPVLSVNKPHLGVDYAASTGTPVKAVGDGVVTVASYNGSAGNMVRIRHNSTYETVYMHLSGFGPGIKKGVRVRQGQVVARVGSTGLSTGPHLHFEFLQLGRHVDPLGRDFPAADPVPKELMSHFQTQAATMLASLPAWDSVQVSLRQPTAQEETPAQNPETL